MHKEPRNYCNCSHSSLLAAGLCGALKAPIDPVRILPDPQRNPERSTAVMGPWSPPSSSQLQGPGTASALESPLKPGVLKDLIQFPPLLTGVLLESAGSWRCCAEGGETLCSILFIPKTKSCTPTWSFLTSSPPCKAGIDCLQPRDPGMDLPHTY